MTDAELIACAAIVNAYAAEVQAANMDRERCGNAMAYDGFPNDGLKYVEALKAALSLRGTVPTNS